MRADRQHRAIVVPRHHTLRARNSRNRQTDRD